MSAESYARELSALIKEMKRVNQHLKKLKQQKASVQKRLYETMKAKGLEEVGQFKLSSLQNKKRLKSMDERKYETIQLFSERGIDNPEDLWEEVREVQKVKREEKKEIPKTKDGRMKKPRKKQDTFDPMLGF